MTIDDLLEQERLAKLQEKIRKFEGMLPGQTVKPFWNLMDCPHAEYCPNKEARAKNLVKHRCLYNPSIFRCEYYIRYEEGK